MKVQKILLLFATTLLPVILMQCDDSTSTDQFAGAFGDQYVFIELSPHFDTDGGFGQMNLQQYVFEDDDYLNLGFPPTISDPTEKFVLIYGLNTTFTGSYTGTMKIAQKAEKVPHTVNFDQFTQSDVSIPVEVQFEKIADNGDVTLLISGTDPDSTQELEYSILLQADSTYTFPTELTFPTTIQGDTVMVTSTYELTNYGFQQKQDINIQSGQ